MGRARGRTDDGAHRGADDEDVRHLRVPSSLRRAGTSYSSHPRRGGESGLAVSENASITFHNGFCADSENLATRARAVEIARAAVVAAKYGSRRMTFQSALVEGRRTRHLGITSGASPPPEVRSRARLTTTRAPWPPRKPPTTRRLPSCRRRTSMGNPSTSSSPRSWVRPSPNSQSDRATRTRPHRPDRVASRAPRQPRAEHSSRAAGGARLLRTSFDGERPLGRRPRFGLANFDSRVVRFRSKSASDRASLPRPPRVSSRKNPRREAHGCGESPGDVHHGEEDGVQGA